MTVELTRWTSILAGAMCLSILSSCGPPLFSRYEHVLPATPPESAKLSAMLGGSPVDPVANQKAAYAAAANDLHASEYHRNTLFQVESAPLIPPWNLPGGTLLTALPWSLADRAVARIEYEGTISGIFEMNYELYTRHGSKWTYFYSIGLGSAHSDEGALKALYSMYDKYMRDPSKGIPPADPY